MFSLRLSYFFVFSILSIAQHVTMSVFKFVILVFARSQVVVASLSELFIAVFTYFISEFLVVH